MLSPDANGGHCGGPQPALTKDDVPVSLAAAATFAAAGDNFAGTDRKAAKLAISNAATQSFTDVKDLIGTLVPDANMIKHGRYTILETDQMDPYDDPKPKVGPST
jgi:protein involved in temperature-dependent protein secretion